MLESISWQEFFTTIAVILGGYYAITVLLLFSSEITHFFKSKPHGAAEPPKLPSESSQPNLMGGVRVERSTQQKLPREEVTASEELQITSQEAEEPIIMVDLVEESLQNDFSSISVEIQSLAEIATQSTREETATLFKTLLSNYPQFIGTPFQEQITQLIYDSCKEVNNHQFDLEEVNSWWTEPN